MPKQSFIAICLLSLFADLGIAQLNRGALTGTVTDVTGAVVPNVKITIRNTATNAAYDTTSNAAGQYTMPNLPIGPYQLTYTAPGLKQLALGGIELGATQVLRVDATLEVGTVTETVQITGEVPRLQTDSPEVGTDLSSRALVDLPLSVGGARNPVNFAFKVTPGVSGDSWNSHINGSTSFSKDVLLDGATTTTYMSGDFASTISVEALEEFKIQTSSLSAEFGRTQAGIFNFVMKSGSNQAHGSAFGALRNEALNANTFSNKTRGARRGLDRQQDWALSFGGPVYIPKVYDGRNRTFFYFTVERFHTAAVTFGAPNRNMPLPEWWDGNFGRLLGPSTGQRDALGRDVARGAIYDPTTFRQMPDGRWIGDAYPGNIIPVSRFSKVSQNLNAIARKTLVPPVRDASGQIPLVNNSYFPSGSLGNDVKQNSIKIDQVISAAQKLSGSFAWGPNPYFQTDEGGLWDTSDPYGGIMSRLRRQQLTGKYGRMAHDYTISPHILNHWTLFYNRFINQDLYVDHPDHTLDGAKKIGLTSLAPMKGFPRINWSPGPFVTNDGPGVYSDQSHYAPAWGFLDTVSFSRGRHFMKAGFDLRRNHYNLQKYLSWPTFSFAARATAIPNEAFSGNLTGFGFASYLLGLVDTAGYSEKINTGERRFYYGAFFQDDFKVSSTLTINLGLRWEYQPPFFEVAGRIASWNPKKFDPESGLPGAYDFAGNCQGCTGKRTFGDRTFKDFGPRIGFAWRPLPKWTVRGGYGIYYEGDLFSHFSFGSLGASTSVQVINTFLGSADPVNPWAGIFNWDGGLPTSRYLPPAYNQSWGNQNRPGMIDPKYGHPGYIQQWNFNIQRQLASNLIVDVGYVGNKSTGLRNGDMALPNQLPVSVLSRYGRNLNNAVRNPSEAAANGVAYPYQGFAGTVASALRQYPQVQGNQTVRVYGSPLGFSTYNSLQVTVNRQFTKGFSAYANYVWSKTMDNYNSSRIGDNPGPVDYYNLALEKSIATFDVPHMFKATLDYQLPFGRGKSLGAGVNKFVDAIAGGWSLTGILNYFSGTPLSFTGSSPLVGGWNGGSNRVNVVPGDLKASGFNRGSFNLADPASPGNVYLNKSLFSDPAPLTIGNAARAYAQARSFATRNEDIGIFKSFRFHETYRVQVRAEALNAFNRHTLGGIQTNVTNPQFGQVTSVSGNRIVQLTARFDF